MGINHKRSAVISRGLPEITVIPISPSHYFEARDELGSGCMGHVDLVYTQYELFPQDEVKAQPRAAATEASPDQLDFESEAFVLERPVQVIKQMEYNPKIYKSRADFREMVIREAQFTNAFSDRPSVHHIFEYTVARRPGMALQMDVIPGKTLKTILENKPDFFWKNPDQLLLMVEQLIESLAHFSRQHIVHRDLKPDNLMWDQKTWKLKVFDGGFAQWEHDEFWGLMPSLTMAAPLYTAPELLKKGYVPEVTCAADTFQAGVILFNSIKMGDKTPEKDPYQSPLFSISENLSRTSDQRPLHYYGALRTTPERDHQGIIDERLNTLESRLNPPALLSARQLGLIMQLLRGMIVIDISKRIPAEDLLTIAKQLPQTREERIALLAEASEDLNV